MGYKSIVRSGLAAANRAAKEHERKIKQEIRETERLQKKIDKANEKLDKIYQVLKDEYAKGKITKEQYTEFKNRKNEITIDLVVIGQTPYISLAKRYITGKIDMNEYNELISEIFPEDFFKENEEIYNELNQQIDKLNSFRNSCSDMKTGDCQKCSTKKSLFNKIKIIDGLMLCKKCTNELNQLKKYKGFQGYYYITDPMTIKFQNIDDGLILKKNININLL